MASVGADALGLHVADSLQRDNRGAGRHPLRDLLGTSWAYLARSQAQGGQLVALLLNAHNAESCLLSQPIGANTVHTHQWIQLMVLLW